MAAIDLETAQDILDHWIEAERAVSLNQEYRIGRETYTRTDADVITHKINYWQRMVNSLENGGNGGMRIRRGILIDD